MLLFSISAMWGTLVQAEVPRVTADIAPVHSLVAQVMEGAGEPDLIMRSGASPHGYAMRPSEALALSESELVFWTGQELTPWLHDAIQTLADDAKSVSLLDQNVTHVLSFREGVSFEEESHEEHDHDHHGLDPHAWLDPVNAKTWLHIIAEELARLDPENANLYRANAQRRERELIEITDELHERLERARGSEMLLTHDAYQYFEARFDIRAAASVSLGDAAKPSPARISALRELAMERGVTCVLTEPQFDAKIAAAILSDGYKKGVLDPLGSSFEPGPELYPNLLRSLAEGFAACGPDQ